MGNKLEFCFSSPLLKTNHRSHPGLHRWPSKMLWLPNRWELPDRFALTTSQKLFWCMWIGLCCIFTAHLFCMHLPLLVWHWRSFVCSKKKETPVFYTVKASKQDKCLASPFICFSLVKRRSKLSTSASPAVRLANSWMSMSVIGSTFGGEAIHILCH